MDFIAIAPADRPATVINDGWFPDIDLAQVRTAMRLDGTVTPARLVAAVVAAVIAVNTELAAWQAEKHRVGWKNLQAVPAATVNGESVLLITYRRAVYYLTKADLTEHYRDFDSTKSGAHQAATRETTMEEDRCTARWAIRDLLGVAHTTVALI